MDNHNIFLHYSDMASNYIRHKSFPVSPQVLEVRRGSDHYRFAVLNTGTEYLHPRSEEVSPPYERFQHEHDVYHLVLYTKGETAMLVDGNYYRTKPGFLAVTEPGEPHCFNLGSPKQCIYDCFSFHLENTIPGQPPIKVPLHELLSLYFGCKLSRRKFPVNLSPDQFLRFKELIEQTTENLIDETDNTRFKTCLSILEILGLLVSEIYLAETDIPGGYESRLDQVKARIERSYAQPVSIGELAMAAGMSEGHFLREFKAKFKTSPIAYCRELRINAAKTLLRASALPIKEIAARTGFSDVYYFTRVFTKLAKTTPAKYRSRGS